MASRPPTSGQSDMAAFVPQIGHLTSRGGLDYDLAMSEEVTHENEHTQHPIEDPQRSFIYDHNRELPTTINLSLLVSTNPLVAGGAMPTSGVDRLTQFQDALTAMRAAQSVDTSAYFDVYTGLRVYHNMGFSSLTFRRTPEEPNVLEVSMTLTEFRFARPPRNEEQAYLMDANDAPRNQANAELVTPVDRPIIEATRSRNSPRMTSPSVQMLSTVKASLSKLNNSHRLSLGIDISRAVETTEEINIMQLDDTPAQQYTRRLGGELHSFEFAYNQLGDRWSFTAGITGADCPRVGGRMVSPGFDLFADLAGDEMLLPLDRPGISTSGLDWYTRLTVPLRDGVPATMLAVGSAAAFTSLFRPRTSVNC